MRSYMAKNLLAASSAVTVSAPVPDDDANAGNELFLDHVFQFTTAVPSRYTTPKSNDDKSLAAEKNEINEELGFSVIITLLFCVGIVVNSACLISLRRHRSTFHRFLKMLACFDVLVVTCIFLMYALPVMSSGYKKVSSLKSRTNDLTRFSLSIVFFRLSSCLRYHFSCHWCTWL